VPSTPYVFTLSAAPGEARDLTTLRGHAIADAQVRFRRMAGNDVLFEPEVDTATVERWGQWLIERLEADDRIYQRSGEGWRLRSGKLHEESERRLGELSGWSDKAIAGQRELLEHVDDPGDSGDELEQSLSKLAAAGWNVDSKKDKGPPTVYFAAGDLPLATGDDWRAPGSLHPRFSAALALLVATLPDALNGDPQTLGADLAVHLPALAIVGDDTNGALLDLRTIAKALRDAGGLDLPDGEPIGSVLSYGGFKLRAVKRKRAAATNGAAAQSPTAPDPGDPDALMAAHGDDVVRFALLHAAAPAKRFAATDDILGYVSGFFADLRAFAAPRLDDAAPGTQIDVSDGLRRRLAGWCDTAVARSAENHERIDPHLATRNAIRLFARIKDFDGRVLEERGELAGADREAVGIVLAVLARLLAPLAPTVAGELWQSTGHGGTADDAWPGLQREPAAA
jgi:hypothetical protein